MIEDLERLATGRDESLFVDDVARHGAEIRSALEGARIAVLGAAGSIGSALTKQLVGIRPKHLSLIDLSENNLVELVRDLRSSPALHVPEGFETLAIGLGSRELARYLEDSPPFDRIFNLCAIKHVRAERSPYAIARMIDTNMIFLDDLLAGLPAPLRHFFSVSTDKATEPVSLMGASKLGMELVLRRHADRHPYSTARFANVAFSDGSLLHGFLRRIEKRQPIAAPRGIRRYFMSHREAGELCLLAGALGRTHDVFVPRLEEDRHARTLPEIAIRTLEHAGFEAFECGSEEEARARMAEALPQGRWPCYFADATTSGEKPIEAFHAASDALDSSRFEAIDVVRSKSDAAAGDRLEPFLAFARAARERRTGKEEYVSAFRSLFGRFDHVETGRDLDQQM
jgi:nucleoside-diphosphate-sugar epimerase